MAEGNAESFMYSSWAYRMDELIAKCSVKFMKISFRGEIRREDLEPIDSPSELFFALQRTEFRAGKSHEDILSRFIYTIRLDHWGHIAVQELERFHIPQPPVYDAALQSDQFKLYQCLAKVYALILRKKACERHVIACCSAEYRNNSKTIPDIYSLLDDMLQKGYLTTTDQKVLLESLAVNKHFNSVEIIQHYRSETNQEEIKYDTQALETDVANVTMLCSSCGLELSMETKGVVDTFTHEDSVPENQSNKVTTILRSKTKDRLQTVSATNPQSRVGDEDTDNNQTNRDSMRSTIGLIPDLNPFRYEVHSYTGNKVSFKRVLLVLTVTISITIVCLLCLVSAIFIASTISNSSHGKALHQSGETTIVSEVKHFFTKSQKVTEDASNPGDSEHLIHLYQYPSRCSNLPLTHTYQQQTRLSSDLDNIAAYLVAGSTIELDICAATNTTEPVERTEVLLLNNLELAKNFNEDSNEYIDFAFFSTGINDMWKCGKTYYYSVSKTSYYVLTFLQPDHEIMYNHTLKLNKTVIDLNSSLLVPACSLSHDKDNCTFNFSMSSQTSCIVAHIKKQETAENLVHIVSESSGQQGNAIAGTIAPMTIVLVTMLITAALLAIMYHKPCGGDQ